ncbi:hypothetical protein [Sciscionella marina]|uniref:hypothetical protein n=1 Tax=Sciscionella marina TaxID=508770 RepID=UPI000382EB80|nr:hypothetical protein [Sciscionella marina]
MASIVETAARFLTEHFHPTGVRLGILVLAECEDAVEEVAAEQLRAHGLRPARRLAKLRPRTTEPTVRSADLVDFLQRYGHEYSVALLPTITMTGQPLDTVAVEQAARRSGCTITWYQ